MMGERRIPHLRDIFGGGGGGGWEPVLPDESKREKQVKQVAGKQPTKHEPVKHLERHLSMKKTIRKKIMRELEQAWVEDPTEFKVEDVPREKLGAELRLDSLSYGARQKGSKSNSFLEFLRGQGGNKQQERGDEREDLRDDDESKSGFWKRLTTKRNKR